ncbi:hypothetical protein [Serratia nevei]|uniref:hypothetical protein n=1 Tax=Serratia nevei TaxID=2703794 RepID=UPI00249B2ABB|nr:hypothetical protein [Serratia nevei]MDI3149336.1 hypothetical protein [Serratia nevei]
MDNKPSELKRLTPRQIAVYRDRVAISDSDYELIPVHTGDLRALLAELEAKDKRIIGLERHVKDIEATLIVATDEVADLTKERDEARAKLATPVRLPKRWDVTGQVNPPRIVEVQFEQQNRTHDQCAKAIRNAGFTVIVEGDE